MFRQSAGGGEPERLTDNPRTQGPRSWSSDGDTIFFDEVTATNGRDLWEYSVGDGSVEEIRATRFNESAPTISPDGRLLAFASNESGQDEVHVARYPEMANQPIVSSSGGRSPRWRADGLELYYLTPEGIMGVPVSDGEDPKFGTPELLVEGVFFDYDVAADGQRFAVIETLPREQTTEPIVVVLNAVRFLDQIADGRRR